MDFEILKKEKNEIEIKMYNEDISFFNLIENIASTKREVDFVAIKKGDNLTKEIFFYIRTKDKPAKDVLLECISEAEENIIGIINSLEKITQD